MLWLWRRLVATAPIRPLAWEPPYAAGAAQEIATTTTTTKDKKTKGGAWNDILHWHYDASEYSCYFILRNPERIGESFVKLNSAMINRKEFEENLSEAKEDILSYVKAMEEALRALEQKIDIVYCEFVQNETGAYKWIFEQPCIKSSILKFLEY